MDTQDLMPVPSQIENYKLMERKFSSSKNSGTTPPPITSSINDEQQQQAAMHSPTTTKTSRNRFHSINETLTPTSTNTLSGSRAQQHHHSQTQLSPQTTHVIRINTNQNNDFTAAQNHQQSSAASAAAFSTSPPNFKFQIGSATTSTSSSPSSVGNRLLFEARQSQAMLNNNFGDPILIDDLEEETILDVREKKKGWNISIIGLKFIY